MSGKVGQHDFDVAAELPEDLAAGATGRREGWCVGDYRDAFELPCSFGNGFENGDALRADGQAVGGVFDVAACMDLAFLVFESRADFEFRKGCVGVLARVECCGDERVCHGVRSSLALC